MHFLNTINLSREQLDHLMESALRFKRGEDRSTPLAGKSVALVFFNPSLRTRASMQVGIYELGGNAVVLEPGGTSWTLECREGVVMSGDKTEHVAEFVRVLERYCVAIGVRTFATLKNWQEERIDPVLNAFARYASVPIINLESAMHHPCQSLADMLTIREKLGTRRKRVVLTWAWIVDEEKMARTNSAIFMHCLPVRRNVIVTDEVIDSPASVVIDEAENRLHVQKAVMSLVLGT
jgi:N-acetylornithine carbamoyltransferase